MVVDAQDRMTSGFNATYAYTANGELATVTSGTNVTTYTYDGRGQLVSAALPAGRGTVTYGLDALGRRIARSLNGTITNRFVYRNSLQVAAEVNASGTVTTRYVYGPLSYTPTYFLRGGTTYAIITDHLGSVRSVVRTSDGTVMQSLTYDPWGKVLTDSSPGFQPFGFAGALYDKDTGLVHVGAREYDGTTGRWTSKDPSRFTGGADLYGYTDDDPINYIDATGSYPQWIHALEEDGYFKTIGDVAAGMASSMTAGLSDVLIRVAGVDDYGSNRSNAYIFGAAGTVGLAASLFFSSSLSSSAPNTPAPAPGVSPPVPPPPIPAPVCTDHPPNPHGGAPAPTSWQPDPMCRPCACIRPRTGFTVLGNMRESKCIKDCNGDPHVCT